MSSSMAAAGTGDEWSDLAVGTLLECYNDKYIELNGGSIGTKGWQDVITKLNSVCAEGKPVYSYRRCKNKLDVMKRRFKIERDRKANNGGVSEWPWFTKMEEIVSRNPRLAGGGGSGGGNETRAAAAPCLQAVNHRHQFDELTGQQQQRRVAVVAQQQLASTEEVSAGQLLSDQQQEDGQTDSAQARNSSPVSNKGGGGGGKRKRKNGCLHNPVRHARDVARIVTEALERMESRRIELMRELELKRNETQLQIARMLIEHNNAMSAAYMRHFRPEPAHYAVVQQQQQHQKQQQQQQQQQNHHPHDHQHL